MNTKITKKQKLTKSNHLNVDFILFISIYVAMWSLQSVYDPTINIPCFRAKIHSCLYQLAGIIGKRNGISLFFYLFQSLFRTPVKFELHHMLPRIFHPLNWRFRGFQMRIYIKVIIISQTFKVLYPNRVKFSHSIFLLMASLTNIQDYS